MPTKSRMRSHRPLTINLVTHFYLPQIRAFQCLGCEPNLERIRVEFSDGKAGAIDTDGIANMAICENGRRGGEGKCEAGGGGGGEMAEMVDVCSICRGDERLHV